MSMEVFPQSPAAIAEANQIAAAVAASTPAANATIMSFENMPDPMGKRPKGRTAQEVAYLSKLFQSQQRIAMLEQHTGKMAVTVVNINPYPLEVNHSLFSDLRVPANKGSEKYAALVIRDVKYQVDTGLDRNHTPIEFWPVQLAAEFSTQYYEKGGVFHINGDLQKHPELAHTNEFKKHYARAEKQLVNYCRKLKATADGEWNTPNRSGSRNIHTTHRTAAQILFDRKLISKLPEWMDGDVLNVEDVTEDCPTCKAPTKKGQTVCAPCGRVLDPFNALKKGDIDEFHASLERLTRKQVEELGVSAYVAETADEIGPRRASGRPKPQSKFELNQQKQLDKEQKAAEKAAEKGKDGK